MYKTFRVKDFRCFTDLSVDNLSRICLITGTNNVGKTAFLEAMFVHAGAYNPDLTMTLNSLRGITHMSINLTQEDEAPWNSIFRDFDPTKTAKFIGEFGNSKSEVRLSCVKSQAEISGLKLSIRQTYEKTLALSSKIPAKVLKLEFQREKSPPHKYFLILDKEGKRVEPTPPVPPFNAMFYLARTRDNAKDESERFSRVQVEGKESTLLAALQILEPRLKSVVLSLEGGEAMLHGDIGSTRRHFVPLAVMGDGINRLANVILLIANVANGVLLIDEVEIGWHYSLLPKIWRAIAEAAVEFNVQVICTTHSFECIQAAHDAFRDDSGYPLSVRRFERRDDNISVVAYDQETLETALENRFEVR